MPLLLLAALPTTASARAYDAFIRISRTAVQPVSSARADHGFGLADYMRLPVDQYCNIQLPLQGSLARTAAPDEFALVVPPLRFGVPGLPLDVSPFVRATVTSEAERVVIASDSCVLSGSPLVEAARLNERFDFRVSTELTWKAGVGGADAITCSTQLDVDMCAAARPTPARLRLLSVRRGPWQRDAQDVHLRADPHPRGHRHRRDAPRARQAAGGLPAQPGSRLRALGG